MSKIYTIALAQFPVERGNPAVNIDRISQLAEEASRLGASVMFLPEMASTGFDWSRNVELLDTAKEQVEEIASIARRHSIEICGSFLSRSANGQPLNRLYYFDANGDVLGTYDKIHLFTLFHEERHVEAGNSIKVIETRIGKMGCSICYDLRFPELFRTCLEAGSVFQVLPAAFPHPRLDHWQTLIRARAIENQSFFIATNQCGSEGHSDGVGETQYFGHSMVVDPWGKVLLEADESEGVFIAEIDVSEVAKIRESLTALDDRRLDLY